MRKIWVVFIALIVVIGTAVIFGRDPFPVVQPPELGDGPITLRVVRAINDRFNSLTEEEFESVLDQTVRSVRYHFGLEVRFERGDDYTIAELFQLIPEPAEELALSLSYTPPLSGVSPEELISSIAIQIENGRVSTANILRFLEASIPGASRMGTKDLAESVAKIWLDGLRAWHGLVAKDGDRVIESTNYHQYAMWDFLGYGHLPFDIVVTNQLAASAERYAFSPANAPGGGQMGGFTGYSRKGQYGSYTMLSTFTYTNDIGDLTHLSPGQFLDSAITARHAALMLTHEIGHLVLLLGHPWNNPDCIMSPSRPRLNGLSSGLDATKCPVGSEPAMTPGAADIRYDRDLLGRLGPWGRFKSAVVAFIVGQADV